ncbi:MAG: hypothetical protein KC561_15920, partial [Myxococcales bacterium]|nr:hypothetical protein [Myxococcales bacterium]
MHRQSFLKSALRQSPSAGTWSEIVTLLNSWPHDDGLNDAISQAEKALEEWPDELRTGNGWWPDAVAGREPRFRLARALTFRRRGIPVSDLAEMCQKAEFAQVTTLRIAVGKGPELVEEVSAATGAGERLASIKELDLSGRQIGVRGAEALSEMRLPSLSRLNLSACGLGAEGLEHIVNASWFSQLTVLDISQSQIDAAAAAVLANAGSGKLEELRVAKTPELDDVAVQSLAAAALPTLATVDLQEGGFSNAGLSALASAAWPALRSLNLWNLSGQCGDAGARALADSWAHETVASLNLGACEIGNAGVQALAENEKFASVHDLNLERSKFEAEGMRTLANSVAFSGVRTLNMNWCTASSIEGMRGSKLASRIEELQIPRTTCGNKGIAALLEGDGLSNLRVIDLTNNAITDAGIDALCNAAAKLSELSELTLSENSISNVALKGLCTSGLTLHGLVL